MPTFLILVLFGCAAPVPDGRYPPEVNTENGARAFGPFRFLDGPQIEPKYDTMLEELQLEPFTVQVQPPIVALSDAAIDALGSTREELERRLAELTLDSLSDNGAIRRIIAPGEPASTDPSVVTIQAKMQSVAFENVITSEEFWLSEIFSTAWRWMRASNFSAINVAVSAEARTTGADSESRFVAASCIGRKVLASGVTEASVTRAQGQASAGEASYGSSGDVVDSSIENIYEPVDKDDLPTALSYGIQGALFRLTERLGNTLSER